MDKSAAEYFQNTDPRFWSFWSFWLFVRHTVRDEPQLKTSADLHNLYVRSLRRLETSSIPHHNTKARALMSRHKKEFKKVGGKIDADLQSAQEQSLHEHEMTVLQNFGERTVLKHTLDGISESYSHRNEIKRNRRNPAYTSPDPRETAEKSKDLFGIAVTDDDTLTDGNSDDSEEDDKIPSATEVEFIVDSGVKKTALGKGSLDEDIEAIRIQAKGKAAGGWVLSNGINVGELFAEYRRAAKETDMFADCHILDIADTAPIRKAVTSLDDEDLWGEIETEWDAKWMDYRPSEQAEQYLKSLRMSTIAEVRSVLMTSYTKDTYNVKIHYDLEYTQTVIRNFISMMEQRVNPLLDDSNTEGFLQVHVYGYLVDRLFSDIPVVQIVRGEKASRAVSYRKNSHRQHGEMKMAATKMDAAIVTRDTWRVELLTLEAGPKDSIEGQSKLLSDRYKLAKGLKDQIDFIYKWLPASQKYRITEVEVFGILTSGLEGCVYAMDLPCSGVYRFGKLFRFELPRQFDSYDLLIKSVARFLALKARLCNALHILHDINRTSADQMLQSDSFWSPRKKRGTQPTRATPTSPTPMMGKKRVVAQGSA